MAERRVFTEEFKRDAVRFANERKNVMESARSLGVEHNMLRRWMTQLGSGMDNPFPGKGNPSDPELAEARREIVRLKEENEILKKAMTIFTNRPR